MSDNNGGESTCPMCGRIWIVTPQDDCFLPGCYCYGTDTSEANPNRPCEQCGLAHAMVCDRDPDAWPWPHDEGGEG
jgi:hypothetical protein